MTSSKLPHQEVIINFCEVSRSWTNGNQYMKKNINKLGNFTKLILGMCELMVTLANLYPNFLSIWAPTHISWACLNVQSHVVARTYPSMKTSFDLQIFAFHESSYNWDYILLNGHANQHSWPPLVYRLPIRHVFPLIASTKYEILSFTLPSQRDKA